MPNRPKLMDHILIKVDGNDLPAKIMDDLLEVTVESSLRLPDMFTIHVHDEQLKWVDEGPFGLGKEVEIGAVKEESGSSLVLIKGEITAIEPDFGEGTKATLLVRGYDRSHRLHRGTYSKAYLQVTDSDLASRIAQEAGLKADVESTSEVYDHVLQHNQTPMEFLSERAQRIGCEFFVDDKTLHFRKPPKNGEPLALEWGLALMSFRPRLTLIEQIDEVVVKGWDAKMRQVFVGHASRGQAEPQTDQPHQGGQLASSAFKGAKRVVVNRHVSSQAEASQLAQAILDEISGALVEAEGMCQGQPDLRAGKFVKLSALGRQFSGTYFVTAATHIYRAEGAYLTSFNIHGRRAETLYALIERSPGQPDGPGWQGTVVGLVTNNKDPEGWGRVKLKFPWLSDDVESDWARVVGSGAGKDRGFYCLPEVNDEVLVTFEHGDPGRPYVIGNLWNGQDKPPLPVEKALENGKVSQRVFKTREGHTLTFKDGKEKGVVLETSGKHRLTLGDEKKLVVLETSGGHRLTLGDDTKKVVLESAGGHVVTLDDTEKKISIESSGALNLKGINLTLEASGQLVLKGTKVDINNGALEVM